MAVHERLATLAGQQQTLGDVVHDQILALIRDGTWPARSRLPSEAELVARFGISRPVVRQALARLREHGVIASRQGSGSFVQDANAALVRPKVEFPAIGSIADLERFLDFREGIEGEAAAAAAFTSHSELIIADLRRAVANAVSTEPVSSDDDFAFHLSVAHASNNPFYVNTLISLREQISFGMNLARSFSARPAEVDAAIAQHHGAIATAIIAHDPDQSRELMRSHLRWSRERLLTGGTSRPDAPSF